MPSSRPVDKVSFAYPPFTESPIVLCVDDDPCILEVVEDVLTACGYTPICTSDCQLALKMVRSERVDALIVDYHMPEMDGITLAQHIRRMRPQLPIILFSSAALPVDALATVTRIVHKGDGGVRLADVIAGCLLAQRGVGRGERAASTAG